MSRPYSLASLSGAQEGVPRRERVLTRDEAVALGEKLLSMVQSRSVGVMIEHTARAITQVVNGRVLATDDGDELAIRFASRFGSGLPVILGTNQLDDTTLRRVASHAEAIATPLPHPEDMEPDDPTDAKYFRYNTRDYLPVSLWHEATITAMNAARADVIPSMVEQIQSSTLMGSATVGISARTALYMYQPGLTAFSRETDCEVTVTARTSDGQASGWSGQANRDWSRLDPPATVAHAIDIASRSRDAHALEPGRRTVILGPAAVAQLVLRMAPLFDARLTDRGGTPFTSLPGSEKRNRLGDRVFDARLDMRSDPQDPEGGFPPFFEVGGSGIAGLPYTKMQWIQRGVLTNLAYDT